MGCSEAEGFRPGFLGPGDGDDCDLDRLALALSAGAEQASEGCRLPEERQGTSQGRRTAPAPADRLTARGADGGTPPGTWPRRLYSITSRHTLLCALHFWSAEGSTL